MKSLSSWFKDCFIEVADFCRTIRQINTSASSTGRSAKSKPMAALQTCCSSRSAIGKSVEMRREVKSAHRKNAPHALESTATQILTHAAWPFSIGPVRALLSGGIYFSIRNGEVRHAATSWEPQFYEAGSNRTNCFLPEFV